MITQTSQGSWRTRIYGAEKDRLEFYILYRTHIAQHVILHCILHTMRFDNASTLYTFSFNRFHRSAHTDNTNNFICMAALFFTCICQFPIVEATSYGMSKQLYIKSRQLPIDNATLHQMLRQLHIDCWFNFTWNVQATPNCGSNFRWRSTAAVKKGVVYQTQNWVGSIPDIFHFFVCHRIIWPVNCTPEKVRKFAAKNCLATKSILGVLSVLVGVLGVFCIEIVYLLLEMEHSELGMVFS